MTHGSSIEDDSALKFMADKQIKDGGKYHDGLTRFAICRRFSCQKARELVRRANLRLWQAVLGLGYMQGRD